MNQGLVQKQQQARQKKTKKYFGVARVLTVEEALKRQEERRAKEEHVMHEKERSAALRGKVGFAKAVWKELYMDFDQPQRVCRVCPRNGFGNGWSDR